MLLTILLNNRYIILSFNTTLRLRVKNHVSGFVVNWIEITAVRRP